MPGPHNFWFLTPPLPPHAGTPETHRARGVCPGFCEQGPSGQHKGISSLDRLSLQQPLVPLGEPLSTPH